MCAYAYGYVHRLSLLKMNSFGPKSAELTARKPSPPLGDTMVARMEFRENSCYHTGPTAARIAYQLAISRAKHSAVLARCATLTNG